MLYLVGSFKLVERQATEGSPRLIEFELETRDGLTVMHRLTLPEAKQAQLPVAIIGGVLGRLVQRLLEAQKQTASDGLRWLRDPESIRDGGAN